jgi:conjugal transfer pilus assembly protein TraV
MKLVPLLLISMVMVLPACSTFTGLDSKSDFKCKAPEGVACESMSGIYANAEADNLPAQRISHRDAAKATQAQLTRAPSHEMRKLPMPNATSSGQPLFRNPEILRIWVAPWEAADQTLYDQNYMYIVVDSGAWQIEHNQRRIRDGYAPIEPPKVNRRAQVMRADSTPPVSQPMTTTP